MVHNSIPVPPLVITHQIRLVISVDETRRVQGQSLRMQWINWVTGRCNMANETQGAEDRPYPTVPGSKIQSSSEERDMCQGRQGTDRIRRVEQYWVRVWSMMKVLSVQSMRKMLSVWSMRKVLSVQHPQSWSRREDEAQNRVSNMAMSHNGSWLMCYTRTGHQVWVTIMQRLCTH